MSKGYVTPTECASALGLDYSDPQVLLDIEIALELVEDLVDQYCSTTFVREDGVTRVYSGCDSPMLSLGYFLRTLTSVNLLNVDGTVSSPMTDVVACPSPPISGAYIWLERRNYTDFGYNATNNFYSGLSNIQVTGDWGFINTPSAVKYAVIQTVKHFFEMRNYSDLLRTESGFGRITEFTPGSEIHYLPASAKMALGRWKNMTRMGG